MFNLGCQMEDGTINVYGNVKGRVGEKMKGGIITIHGSAMHDVGVLMENGTIIVDKAEWFVGSGMKGGLINIKESADTGIGHRMKGGKIMLEINNRFTHLFEDYLRHATGGEIYHKGRLILKDGAYV